MVRNITKSVIDGSMIQYNHCQTTSIANSIVSLPSADGHHSIQFNGEMLSKHLLLIGAIGTGKTNVIHKVMKDLNYLDYQSFAMIFDTKGDFYRYYNPHKDILISTSRKYRDITNYYNIFKEIQAYSSDSVEQRSFIREIAKSFFVNRRNESQPFFTNAAQQLFANILIAFHEGMIVPDRNKKIDKDDIFNITSKK